MSYIKSLMGVIVYAICHGAVGLLSANKSDNGGALINGVNIN